MQVRVKKGCNMQKKLNLGNCEIDWYCQKEQEEKNSLAKNTIKALCKLVVRWKRRYSASNATIEILLNLT